MLFNSEGGRTHILHSGGVDPVVDVIERIRTFWPDILEEKFVVDQGPALYELRCQN